MALSPTRAGRRKCIPGQVSLIVFLDIDGVLNSAEWLMHQPVAARRYPPPSHATRAWRERRLDPAAVGCLQRLIRHTGASIVLMSDWRSRMPLTEFSKLLEYFGWETPPVIGTTPVIRHAIRGEEVATWRLTHASVCPYVCLDDEDYFLPEQPLVLTRPQVGLSEEDVDQCIDLLTNANR